MMETALARAALYNLLAASFGDPPTEKLVETWAHLLPAAPLAPLDDLRRAYTRLLVGPGGGYAPPFASIYLDPPGAGKPLLWGAEAGVVEAVYRAAGLEIAPGQQRVPDHLALELQFMQHLCAREAGAIVNQDLDQAQTWQERQSAFLVDHLWNWLPQFAARVHQVGAHPLYCALVKFTLEFVQSELEAVPVPTASPLALRPAGVPSISSGATACVSM